LSLPRTFARARPFLLAGHRLKFVLRRRSIERQSDQNLGHEAERERYHEQQAETGENLQWRWWIDFIRIVSIHAL
jgi:hypothetical protein